MSSPSEFLTAVHDRHFSLSSIVGQNPVFLPPFSQISTNQNVICQESVVAWSTLDGLFSSISVHGLLQAKEKVTVSRIFQSSLLLSIQGCARGLTVRDRYQDETLDSETAAKTEAFVKPSKMRP